MGETPLEYVLQRDRLVVSASLLLLTVFSWLYVLRLAADMDMHGMPMEGMQMLSSGLAMVMAPARHAWTPTEFVLMFVMWAVMMVGMMTPSVAPLLLLYARVGRQAKRDGGPLAATVWFASGYLSAWSAFALGATVVQSVLERAAWLNPTMAAASPLFGGLLLVAAGVYQWTPLKQRCLAQCQSPLAFLQRHGGFRRDVAGSFALGARHGIYCLGCCWVLMALLLVGGVMNVTWIAALAILALVEKLSPAGPRIARIAGVAIALAGLALITGW